MSMANAKVLRHKALPLLALRGLVVFPGVVYHLDVGRKKSLEALRTAMSRDQMLFLVTQQSEETEAPTLDELYPVGVVAAVRQILKLPGDGLRVLVEGLYRAKVVDVNQAEPFYHVEVTECRERSVADPLREEAYIRRLVSRYYEYDKLLVEHNAESDIRLTDDLTCAEVIDRIASALPLKTEEKERILSLATVSVRAEFLLNLLEREYRVMELENRINQRVQDQVDDNQRDYYLREQIKAINEELGNGEDPTQEAAEYRAKIEKLDASDEVKNVLLKECRKLEKMPDGSHEATVVRLYLDTCLELPWNTYCEENLDLKKAREVLDRDHYGMQKVKERVIEMLAVRHLQPKLKGQIVCLVGPPGVGKTSIARSVAETTGRPYVRVSLGGVRDESEIRGHRRTYIGAMMGRIMNAMKRAKVKNPLILLDEIDKLSHDFNGDPASALLEVLDAEQNFAFTDRYVDMPFDLSDVLFMTTANDAGNIPSPLYDRMDVIQLGSYTAEEKWHIAKQHLLPKQIKANGLKPSQLRVSDDVLREIIDGYTREAGVRQLEREIGKLCRKAACRIVDGSAKRVTVNAVETLLGPRKFKPDVLNKKDEIGVVNGLAWTSVGGELLPIEVAILDGTGKIELTGSLGDVMKESARIAISYARAHAKEWNIDSDFYKNKDIHIHAPEGAVPKDGPSAGIAMTTALISALTGIPVRHDVAMTGEISLRGHVLPIGGLREKSMAAYTHGMTRVIIPEENTPDLAEVDEAVKKGLQFVPVKYYEEVMALALTDLPNKAVTAHEKAETPLMPLPKENRKPYTHRT